MKCKGPNMCGSKCHLVRSTFDNFAPFLTPLDTLTNSALVSLTWRNHFGQSKFVKGREHKWPAVEGPPNYLLVLHQFFITYSLDLHHFFISSPSVIRQIFISSPSVLHKFHISFHSFFNGSSSVLHQLFFCYSKLLHQFFINSIFISSSSGI